MKWEDSSSIHESVDLEGGLEGLIDQICLSLIHCGYLVDPAPQTHVITTTCLVLLLSFLAEGCL